MMMFLTIKQVSQILQIKEKTLYAWAKKGRLPSQDFFGLVRIPLDKFIKFLQETGLSYSSSHILSFAKDSPKPFTELFKEVLNEILYNQDRGNRTKIEP